MGYFVQYVPLTKSLSDGGLDKFERGIVNSPRVRYACHPSIRRIEGREKRKRPSLMEAKWVIYSLGCGVDRRVNRATNRNRILITSYEFILYLTRYPASGESLKTNYEKPVLNINHCFYSYAYSVQACSTNKPI
jgi:hypothetical protein